MELETDIQACSTMPFHTDPIPPEGNVEQPTYLKTEDDTVKATQSSAENEKTGRFRKGCVRRIPERYPRSCACIGGIILPLWLLVFVAFLGGKFLASFEAPQEFETNDAILASRTTFLLTKGGLSDMIDKLLKLPQSCLYDYLKMYKPEGTNTTLYELFMGNSTYLDGELNLADLTILAQIPGLSAYMEECGFEAEIVINALLEIRNDTSVELASQSLTFNWIRCWNETLFGDRTSLRATDELLAAAAQQDDYYVTVWNDNKQRLYDQYVEDYDGDNFTDFDRLDLWQRAIAGATGSDGCGENVAGTAWFFFTVMTTIGYGNQVIQTGQGRALVACFGFFSILAFGAVSAAASQILIVVFDDFVKRCNLKVLSRPAVSVVLWTLIAFSWTMFFASKSYDWWRDRVPAEDQPYASFWDSVWFAYLTTTTIGLGDFYYQPDYIFVADVFWLSLTCLLCFVFFATLIGQIVALFSGIFPDPVGKLRSRVERTNWTNAEVLEETTVETKLITLLQELLVEGKDDSPASLAVIIKEEELLKKMLELRTEDRQRMECLTPT